MISERQVSEVLEEAYIVLGVDGIYDQESHKWQTRGRDKYRGDCLWHPSKSGTSFYVNPSTLLWRCPTCGGGSPTQYLWRRRGGAGETPRGRDFIEFAREIIALAGLEFPEREPTPEQKEASTRRLVLESVVAQAEATLWALEGTKALDYLRSRGLTDETIREFRLGFYDDHRKFAKEFSNVPPETLRKWGAIWPLADKYITTPWYDETGRLLTVYGRYFEKIPEVEGKRIAKLLAWPGKGTKRSPLFFDRVRRARHDEIVIVEGVFDVMHLHIAGDTRAIATVGSVLGHEQAEVLKKCGIKRAYICGDPDVSGDKGTHGNIKALDVVGIESFVMARLPDEQDPDDVVQAEGVDAWRSRVTASIPATQFRVEAAIGLAGDSKQSRKDAALAVVQTLTGTKREDALQLASERLGYSAQALAEDLGSRHLATPPGAAKPPLGERPTIRLTHELHGTIDESISALCADDTLFQRNGWVQAAMGDFGMEISAVDAASLKDRLTKHAVFEKYDAKSSEWKRATPTEDVVKGTMSRRPILGVRNLERIIEAPTIRPDGTVLDIPGYDAKLRCLYVPSAKFPVVPEFPTAEDAAQALAELEHVFCDFTYERPAHKAASIAAILTIIGRQAIAGATPAFIFDASTRGAGKSMQSDCVSLISTGHLSAKADYSTDDIEMNKAIMSIAMQGDAVVNFDNLTEAFGGPVIDRCITAAETISGRILGKNEHKKFAWKTVVMATGNNVRFLKDGSRRSIVSRLEPTLENPENRTDFEHPDLIPWVRDNYPRLAVAALTILRAYFVAGKPKQGTQVWGSFEAWSQLIPPAIVFAGGADPMLSRPVVSGEEDETKTALSILLTEFPRIFAEPVSLGNLITKLYPNERLRGRDKLDPDGMESAREAIEMLVSVKSGQAPDLGRLGVAFKSLKDRVVGNKKLICKTAAGGVRKWNIQTIAEPAVQIVDDTSCPPRPEITVLPAEGSQVELVSLTSTLELQDGVSVSNAGAPITLHIAPSPVRPDGETVVVHDPPLSPDVCPYCEKPKCSHMVSVDDRMWNFDHWQALEPPQAPTFDRNAPIEVSDEDYNDGFYLPKD